MNEKKGKITILAGNVLGIINKPWEKLGMIPDYITMKEASLLEGVYVVRIDFNDFESIVFTSLSGGYDLYYFLNDNEILYDHDFWRLSKKISRLHWDEDECRFFKKKGYLRPGKTLFKEIKRVELGYCIHIINNQYKIEKLHLPNFDVNYKKFIITIKNSIEMYTKKNSNNAVLFSGGKDSAMLALIMKKELGLPISLYSAEYTNPTGFTMNKKDVERVEFYKKYLNVPIKKIEVNCDLLSFDEIRYLIPRMPFGAHPASIFKFLLDQIELDYKDVILWTGQNADTVYGMGNTESNLPTSIVRYFLTNNYLKSLTDTDNKIFGKIIGSLISFMYFVYRKKRVYRSRNSKEYIDNAMNGINFMGDKKSAKKISRRNTTNINMVRQQVWDNYQSAHLTGMDHQVIRNIGNINIRRVFPYSTVSSMLMFRSIQFGFGDVFIPKRYISQYIKETIGNDNFRKLYPNEFKLGNDNIVSDFEKKVIFETNYGSTLRKNVNDDNVFSMQELVSKIWIKEIETLLLDNGILVEK